MKKTLELKDKVCVITGAGKGIGYETAKQFSQLGCKLALISRDNNDLIALSNELKLNKNDILIMEGDVSVEKTVIEFVNNAIEQFGHIDILFNNAGMRFRKEFIDITIDEWQKVMTTNVTSTFLICREVGKSMIKQKFGKTIQKLIPEKIIGYVDIKDENHHPSTLKQLKYDKILISVLGREEIIKKYLIQELFIPKDKIITI